MKKTLAISFLLFFALGCGNNDRKSPTSENDIDAARNFVRAALDGDYDKAKTFMLQDSINLEDLNTVIRLNERLSPEEKSKYRESTIRIHQTRRLNDSASVIIYSNSFRNQQDSLLVINEKGRWMVDFKYIFQHKTDSLP